MALYKSFLGSVSASFTQRSLTFSTSSSVPRRWSRYLGDKHIQSELKFQRRLAKKGNGSRIAKCGLGPENMETFYQGIAERQMTPSMLWKPFIFTVSFSAGALATCAIWQYESLRKKAIYHLEMRRLWNNRKQLWGSKEQTSFKDEIKRMWNNLSEAEKVFIPIAVLNVLVHLAWKKRGNEITMIRYFASSPTNRALCWPLVLSTFSHYGLIHLGMNMFALRSFSGLCVDALGKEQFLGLYLVGGVVSSFVSLLFRTLTRTPSLSLGASGAILAVTGYIVAKHPELELTIIGLPMFSFTAGSAITTLILFDTCGLLFGWKLFDHAGHLGGVFMGLFWHYWGSRNIWEKREPFLQWWHDIRNADK